MSNTEWTELDKKHFRAALAAAEAAKKEVFKFEGNDVLVEHARELVKVWAQMKKGK